MKLLEDNFSLSTQFIKAKNVINSMMRDQQNLHDIQDIQKQEEYQQFKYLKDSKDKIDLIAMKQILKDRNLNNENICNNIKQNVPSHLKNGENRKYQVKYKEELDKKNIEMKNFKAKTRWGFLVNM